MEDRQEQRQGARAGEDADGTHESQRERWRETCGGIAEMDGG
jgi:hypothetical protein